MECEDGVHVGYRVSNWQFGMFPDQLLAGSQSQLNIRWPVCMAGACKPPSFVPALAICYP